MENDNKHILWMVILYIKAALKKLHAKMKWYI